MTGMFQITGSVAATTGDHKPADKVTQAENDNKSDNVEKKSICKANNCKCPKDWVPIILKLEILRS